MSAKEIKADMDLRYQTGDAFPDTVKALEDSDEEFIGRMRPLGRRAGPEFGSRYIILARKCV
jgi:hypothetical protein